MPLGPTNHMRHIPQATALPPGAPTDLKVNHEYPEEPRHAKEVVQTNHNYGKYIDENFLQKSAAMAAKQERVRSGQRVFTRDTDNLHKTPRRQRKLESEDSNTSISVKMNGPGCQPERWEDNNNPDADEEDSVYQKFMDLNPPPTLVREEDDTAEDVDWEKTDRPLETLQERSPPSQTNFEPPTPSIEPAQSSINPPQLDAEPEPAEPVTERYKPAAEYYEPMHEQDKPTADRLNSQNQLYEPNPERYEEMAESFKLSPKPDDLSSKPSTPSTQVEPEAEALETFAAYLMLDSGALAGPFLYETFIEESKTGLPTADGMKNRAFNSTNPNEYSSRSHSMLTVMIDSEIQDPEDENVYFTKHGKLTFVDLAGSEKLKDNEHMSSGQLMETNNINKSLLVLGNCISALSDPKKRNGHIPYRDSKLTKLLADSLGGNGVTLMIACASGEAANSIETMNTLRYASRARKIENKPVIKMDPREEQIKTLKKEVKLLKQENGYLREQVQISRSVSRAKQNGHPETPLKPITPVVNGSAGLPSNQLVIQPNTPGEPPSPPAPTAVTPSAATGAAGSQGQQQADNGLYEMLQEYMVENEKLKSENSDLAKYKDRFNRDQEVMARENEHLAKKVDQLSNELRTVKDELFARPRVAYVLPGSRGSAATNSIASGIHSNPQSVPPSNTASAIQRQQQQQQQQQQQLQLQQQPQSQPQSQPPGAASPAVSNYILNSQQQIQQLQAAQQQQQHQLQQLQFVQLQQQAVMMRPAAHLAYPSRPPHRLPPTDGGALYQQQRVYREAPPAPPPVKPNQPSYAAKYERQRPNAVSPRQGNTNNIDDMNERLRHELHELDGAINQHQRTNALNHDIRTVAHKRTV